MLWLDVPLDWFPNVYISDVILVSLTAVPISFSGVQKRSVYSNYSYQYGICSVAQYESYIVLVEAFADKRPSHLSIWHAISGHCFKECWLRN